MAEQATKVEQAARWVLYHGTSTLRLKRILAENRLRTSPTGDPKIALTTELSVAQYFACNKVFGDSLGHQGAESEPVILTIDGEGLLALHYELESFFDPVWGDGQCDWENEISCWEDIDPLDEVLVAIEPVPEDRWRAYRETRDFERRRDTFKPSGPRLVDYELSVMEETVDRLEGGEITEAKASAIAAAINLLRQSVRSGDLRPTSNG